jgi:general secretion pathway protein J
MKGYTLIEVIIALAIFAILGTLSVGLLSRAFDTKARLAAQIEPLTELQLAATRITQDMSQIINRPVLNQDQKETPALIANADGIVFTRGGFVRFNPKASDSTLRRIALSCNGQALVRKTWPKLDAFDSTPPQTQTLLSSLTHCSFSFMSRDKIWSNQWEKETTPFPAAFKLHLGLQDFGQITLIFMIPGHQNEK